jgi:hypothetical protein
MSIYPFRVTHDVHQKKVVRAELKEGSKKKFGSLRKQSRRRRR